MFEFNADGFKKMNPIKINPYRPILRRLISGNLSADISNIDRFFLQMIWANDFPISHRQGAKKGYRPISRLIFKTMSPLWLQSSNRSPGLRTMLIL